VLRDAALRAAPQHEGEHRPHQQLHRASGANTTIGKILQVIVRDNNVEQALRVLKKKLQREGVFREMKRRKAYEKPSERKTREKAEAVRRARKAARKQAQREGLVPMPKKREAPPRRSPPRPSF
jgi:small subunit ribosomal protein S21